MQRCYQVGGFVLLPLWQGTWAGNDRGKVGQRFDHGAVVDSRLVVWRAHRPRSSAIKRRSTAFLWSRRLGVPGGITVLHCWYSGDPCWIDFVASAWYRYGNLSCRNSKARVPHTSITLVCYSVCKKYDWVTQVVQTIFTVAVCKARGAQKCNVQE